MKKGSRRGTEDREEEREKERGEGRTNLTLTYVNLCRKNEKN